MSSVNSSALPCEQRDFNISRMTEHDLLEVVEIEEASRLSLWGWDAYHSELKQGSEALMLTNGARGWLVESSHPSHHYRQAVKSRSRRSDRLTGLGP